MTVEKLLREGWLKKVPPSKERAVKSLEVADRFLGSARKSFDIASYDMAIMAAYSAAFHAARAVLFLDGFAERSHFAVYDYLREKHKDLGMAEVESFNAYRRLRHGVAYGLDTVVNEDDALSAIAFAERFLKCVKAYLKL